MRGARPDRRARRLVRWYPREWRRRYGEEFAQLLTDDIEERSRSWQRTLDVARGGLTARVARLPRPQLVAAALIFGTALAVAAVLPAFVDPNREIKCPAHIRKPSGATCLIVPGHGWVNPVALAIASLGVVVASGVLLAAVLRPRQRRIAGAVAIVGVGVAVAAWVATYREQVPVDPYLYPRFAAAFYPSRALAAAEAALIGVAAVGVAMAVLRCRRPLTRSRLAAVLVVLATALAAASIPHVVRDPGGLVDCNVRGLPFRGSPGCPRLHGPVWLDPTALALGALAVVGAAGLLATRRRA